MAKASREVLSTKSPASASRGAKATACTRMSSEPHWLPSAANTALTSASTVTSMGSTIFEPTEAASGSTRSLSFSWPKVKASSAPCSCMAWAMPQAIERSVATPTISARLPERIPMSAPFAMRMGRDDSSSGTLAPVGDESLSRLDGAVGEVVPAAQRSHRHLQHTGNARESVAALHHVGELLAIGAHDERTTAASRAAAVGVQLDALPHTQDRGALNAIEPRQGAHAHLVALGDAG